MVHLTGHFAKSAWNERRRLSGQSERTICVQSVLFKLTSTSHFTPHSPIYSVHFQCILGVSVTHTHTLILQCFIGSYLKSSTVDRHAVGAENWTSDLLTGQQCALLPEPQAQIHRDWDSVYWSWFAIRGLLDKPKRKLQAPLLFIFCYRWASLWLYWFCSEEWGNCVDVRKITTQ